MKTMEKEGLFFMPRKWNCKQNDLLALVFVIFFICAVPTGSALAESSNPKFSEFNAPQLGYSKAEQKWLLIADSKKIDVPPDLKPIPVKDAYGLCREIERLDIEGKKVQILWGSGSGVFNRVAAYFKPGTFDCNELPGPMRLWLLTMEYPHIKGKHKRDWGEAQDLRPPKMSLVPCGYSPMSVNFLTYTTSKGPRKFIAFPYHKDDAPCIETLGEVRAIAARHIGQYSTKISAVQQVKGATFRVVHVYDLTKN